MEIKTNKNESDKSDKTDKSDKLDISDDNFKCPITLDYMREPVMASDGHFYEKFAIQNWFKTHNTSPLTNKIIDEKLTVCYFFNEKINEFYKQNLHLKPVTESDLLDPKFNNFDAEQVTNYLSIIGDINNEEKMFRIFERTNLISFIIENYPTTSYKFEQNMPFTHHVCMNCPSSLIEKMFRNNNVNLESASPRGFKPIHIICSDKIIMLGNDRINLLQLLIDRNVDVNATSIRGIKPIDLVCELNNSIPNKDYLEMTTMLIDAGAIVKKMKITVS